MTERTSAASVEAVAAQLCETRVRIVESAHRFGATPERCVADRGEFVAKGFEEPVRVYEVRWEG